MMCNNFQQKVYFLFDNVILGLFWVAVNNVS